MNEFVIRASIFQQDSIIDKNISQFIYSHTPSHLIQNKDFLARVKHFYIY